MSGNIPSALFSIAYFPPIQYYSKMLLFNNIRVEQHENFPKQSFRNRCYIYGANGLQALHLPVVKGRSNKTKTRDIRLSYNENWQKNHWKSIESAYRSSPFFEFFEDEFSIFYSKHFDFLLDFNLQIINVLNKNLGISPTIELSTEFQATSQFPDFRDFIHPKKDFSEDNTFHPSPYQQVFSQKHGFIANLSILDLLCNLGAHANDYLKTSCGK